MVIIRLFRWGSILALGLAIACTEAAVAPPPEGSTPPSTDGATEAALTTVTTADINFGEGLSTPIISSAQKFILPVPPLTDGGAPLVYPPDKAQAGQPILDYQGNPIGDRGLVFYNFADNSVQAVAGDGQGVVIINEVAVNQADALHRYIGAITDDPTHLTLGQLKDILTYARTDLSLGDMYNSSRAYVADNMVPLNPAGTEPITFATDEIYGFKARNNQEILAAVYIPGRFQFQGPAATPQRFEAGGVIVQEGDELRGVQPDIFIRTYTFSNGQTITDLPAEVATQRPF